MVVLPSVPRPTSPAVPRGLGAANRANLRQALAEEGFFKPDELLKRRLQLALEAAKEKVCIDFENGELAPPGPPSRTQQNGVQCQVPKGYFVEFVEKVVQLLHQQAAPRWEQEEKVFVRRLAENTRSFMREDDAYHERLVPGARPSRLVNPKCIEEELYFYEPLQYWDDEQQQVMREIIAERMRQLDPSSHTLPKRISKGDSPKNSKKVKLSERRLSSKSTADEEESSDDDERELMEQRQRMLEARKSKVEKEMMMQLHEKDKFGQMEKEVSDLEKLQESLRRQIEAAKSALATAESERSRMQKESKAAAEKVEKLRTEVKMGQMRADQVQADQMHADPAHAEQTRSDQTFDPRMHGEREVPGLSAALQPATSANGSMASSKAHGTATAGSVEARISQGIHGEAHSDDVACHIDQARAAEEAKAARERARLKARVAELLKLIASVDGGSHTYSQSQPRKQTKGDSSVGDSAAVGHASVAKGLARSATSAYVGHGKREQESDANSLDETKDTSTTRDETLRTPERSLNASMKKILRPPKVRGIFQRMHDEASNKMMRSAALREDQLIAEEDRFVQNMEGSGRYGMEFSGTKDKVTATGSSSQMSPSPKKESKPPPQLVAAHSSLGKRNRARQERRSGQLESAPQRSESAPQRRNLKGSPGMGSTAMSRPVSRGDLGDSRGGAAASRPVSRGDHGDIRGSAAMSRAVSRGDLGDTRATAAMSRPVSRGDLGDSRSGTAISQPVSRGDLGDARGSAAMSRPVSRGDLGDSRSGAAVSRPVSRGDLRDTRGSAAVSRAVSRGDLAGSSRDNMAGNPFGSTGSQTNGSVGGNAIGHSRGGAAPSQPGDTLKLGETLAGDRERAAGGANAMGNSRVSAASLTGWTKKGSTGGSVLGHSRGNMALSQPVARASTEAKPGDSLAAGNLSDALGTWPASHGSTMPPWPPSKGKAAPSLAASAEDSMSHLADDSDSHLAAGSSQMTVHPTDMQDIMTAQQEAHSLGDARVEVRFSGEADMAIKAVGIGSATPDKVQFFDGSESLGPPDHWGWSVLYTTKGPTGRL